MEDQVVAKQGSESAKLMTSESRLQMLSPGYPGI